MLDAKARTQKEGRMQERGAWVGGNAGRSSCWSCGGEAGHSRFWKCGGSAGRSRCWSGGGNGGDGSCWGHASWRQCPGGGGSCGGLPRWGDRCRRWRRPGSWRTSHHHRLQRSLRGNATRQHHTYGILKIATFAQPSILERALGPAPLSLAFSFQHLCETALLISTWQSACLEMSQNVTRKAVRS